uniref:F-box protein 7 n=1 Tax=Lates calcarifer TaxID=8187 RepID=A0A4W6F3L8_LATCA
MKLRVRINRQTCRVELPGEEPSLTELTDHIRGTVLVSHGLSADTEFSLSLNGSELLSDAGQTLSSCGIVSGDLICVILPESAAAASAATASTSSSNTSTTGTERDIRKPQIKTCSLFQEICYMSIREEKSGSPCCAVRPRRVRLLSSLELLYHTAQTSSPSDAVMVAGNLLMLETGFVPQVRLGGSGPVLSSPGEMPDGWRSAGGVYKLQYTHPLCENSLAMVVGVCMGPVLVINATLRANQTVDTVRKLCLNPSSYVTDEWPGESAAAAFKDLSKLSRVFKDQLAYPLIAAAREAMALPVAFGLAALPPELLLRVLRLLDVRSVVRLSSVCRHFNVATADSTLWRHLYRRDFTGETPSGQSLNHRDSLYKRSYKLRCEHRHIVRHRSLPPFPRNPRDIFSSVPLPLHPPVPGIIGGDYDQRPTLPHGLLPRPLFDPIGPPQDIGRRPLNDFRRPRPMGGRPADVQRGFI